METENKQVEIIRKKSPAERLELAFGLFNFARQRITAELHRQNPQITPQELNKLVSQRFLG